MSSAIAHINRIGTAMPPHDVHGAFLNFVLDSFADAKERRVFERMVGRSGIEHRYSFLEPVTLPDGRAAVRDGFYGHGEWPSTAERMARYEATAPGLALNAVERALEGEDRSRITHLVVASCTGFVAPGLDQLLVTSAGLDPGVERTVVGFMGCYAAVNAVRLAHHFIRSEPHARVLVVNLELSTLHFQRSQDLEQLLAMLLFGDGCAAALVTADPIGLALKDFRAATIEASAGDITWRIGDQGFDMHLSGEVPGKIGVALGRQLEADARGLLRGESPAAYDLWAVHAGGRSILDAVETAFRLPAHTLDWSREVLRECGNMSSATLMFVLERILKRAPGEPGARGFAVAFGPGLAAESFRFSVAR